MTVNPNIVQDLSRAIDAMNGQAFDDMLEQYKSAHPIDVDLEHLFQKMIHTGIYPNPSVPMGDPRREQMVCTAECKWLSVLVLHQQLQLIHMSFHPKRMTAEHMMCVHPATGKHNQGHTTMMLGQLLVALLYHNRWDALHTLEQNWKKSHQVLPWLLHTNKMHAHYTVENTQGSFLLEFDQSLPWFAGMHFNGSEEKIDYMHARGATSDKINMSLSVFAHTDNYSHHAQKKCLIEQKQQAHAAVDAWELRRRTPTPTFPHARKKVM